MFWNSAFIFWVPWQLLIKLDTQILSCLCFIQFISMFTLMACLKIYFFSLVVWLNFWNFQLYHSRYAINTVYFNFLTFIRFWGRIRKD